MSDRKTKTQRWLDLIAYLVGRRYPVTAEHILEAVPAYAEKWTRGDATAQATAKRTFERDKAELRRAGIPLKTVNYHVDYGEPVEGYLIARKDFYLPYLRLIEEAERAEGGGADPAGTAGRKDPGAAVRRRQAGAETLEIEESAVRDALDALQRVAEMPSFPLREEARSAYRKMVFDLDVTAFPSPRMLFVDRPGAAELVERLRVISDALLARKRVRFRYHGIYRDEATDRDVAAYGLLFQSGHWYMIGHDATRDAIRVFRVGRMEDVSPNPRSPGTPDYEIPETFRLEDYKGRAAWELGAEGEAPIRAKVLFGFPASLYAERNRHGELIETRPDGSAVRAFDVVQIDPFLRWLLSMEGDATVLEPPELADALRTMAREVVAAHGGARVSHAGAAEEGDDA